MRALTPDNRLTAARCACGDDPSLLRFEPRVRHFVQMVYSRRQDHAHALEGAA